ncbi:MAG TPA: hypothetical protein VGK27_10160 [Candidatus Deferrimicrobiaceae bacterium]|jgi:hypothetical protein
MSGPADIPPIFDLPSLEERQEPDYTTCPFCTMQMAPNLPVCPHCHSRNPAVREFRELLVEPERFPAVKAFFRRNWQAVALGAAIALAFLVAAIVYYGWAGHRLVVVGNPSFHMKVDYKIEDGMLILDGTIRNLGEDVPDLSLKSIRVTATFELEGGRKRIESVFPRSRDRGEGSLLRGETGTFRFTVPEKEVEEATLSSEVIDLTCGQPSQRCENPPVARTRKKSR